MLEIIYQDDDLVAVNKPAGWLVHRSWLDKHETVFVMQTVRDQIGQHVYTVHRLDRPTSGVLLMALSSEVARALTNQFQAHQIEKHYQAVVRGFVTEQGTIDYPLLEMLDKIADKFAAPNKPAQTAVSTYCGCSTLELPIAVGRYNTARYSLIDLTPQTGRKHQLRRHMKHISHPIMGDSTYGDLRQNRAFAEYSGVARLMLHANELRLKHPVTHRDLILQAQGDEEWQKVVSLFHDQ